MSDLHWMSAAEAGRAIAEGTLSPVELTRAALERIERLNPHVHAVLQIDVERVMAEACAAEREARLGQFRSALHGVPAGIKDVIDVAGLRTTCHSRILARNVAQADAACVERLRHAGVIVLGKLSAHEFAIGGPSFDLPWPPARNPWNLDHHPGGSSSGSGAALAAGMMPLALGTDTMGSIRHPASACGIVGLKPTFGLVSRHGVFPLASGLDHVGPMARTVRDCALMLGILAGFDPRDPGSTDPPRTDDFAGGLESGVRGLRIGFVRHLHTLDLPADAEVATALESVALALRAEGAVVRDIHLPPLRVVNATASTLLFSQSWAVHARWLSERPGDYGQSARKRLMAGAFISSADVARAEILRQRIVESVDAVLQDVDVLLCASLMDPPCRIDDLAEIERTFPRQTRTVFNVTGHPALAMRSGLSSRGLPLSVQFAGRYFDEATVLRVARTWERAAGIDTVHAPIDHLH